MSILGFDEVVMELNLECSSNVVLQLRTTLAHGTTFSVSCAKLCVKFPNDIHIIYSMNPSKIILSKIGYSL